MSKVKMSDVTSGSQNVKDIFKLPLNKRTSKWLKEHYFTNEELLEILLICKTIEKHDQSRDFYQRLILSQNGPFNAEVFRYFISVVYDVSALVHLLLKSIGITEKDKFNWINITIFVDMNWFITNFYMSEKYKDSPINIKQYPYNVELSKAMVKFKKSVGNCVFPTEYKAFMWTILDTMDDAALFEWYEDVVKSTYYESAIGFLTKYPRVTSNILEDYYNKTYRTELVVHPNFPSNLKLDIFKRTGDKKYLPKEADIFLF